MTTVHCKTEPDWLTQTVEGVRAVGYTIVEGVLDGPFLDRTRKAMYEVRDAIRRDVGQERLQRAGELGVLRLMMCYDDHFLRFLGLPELLAVVDRTVSPTAILHLQNGLLLSSLPRSETPRIFQNQFHRDFPRYLNGYLASISLLFAIDEFTEENGGTLLVPGTHQHADPFDPKYLEARAIPARCPAGSVIVFDSTLWHAAGANVSGKDRLGVNHQFTRSFIKQQVDYVRALGDERLCTQPPRTQQLLGWYTRVVTSLEEYYRPPEQRLYRSGQG